MHSLNNCFFFILYKYTQKYSIQYSTAGYISAVPV